MIVMNKPSYKLKLKLILSYILLSTAIIGVISILVNVSVQNGFKDYVIENHNKNVQSLINSLNHSYIETGDYNLMTIEHLGIEAIEQGLIIQINSPEGQIIWSAYEHNAGLCETMITNLRDNMFDHYANWDGTFTEEAYELNTDDKLYGRLIVGYLGPYYFNEEELYFLTTVNQVLLTVGVAALIIAAIIGLIISNSITKPIEQVVVHLNRIQNNASNNVPQFNTGAIELNALYESAVTLEKRIEEQTTLRKQLTQDMAHELKTPLAAIQGQLEAMIDEILPTTKERLTGCSDEIMHIKELINEIETLSTLENSNTILNIEPFNLLKLLDELKSTYTSPSLSNPLIVTVSHGSNYNQEIYLSLNADRNKMKQVFINLLDNTSKYAGYKPEVTLNLDNDENGNLLIQYKDNGQGIAEKDKPYVFERFYRADPSRTGHQGLGIGLTLVKSIIEKHGGSIQLDSSSGINIEDDTSTVFNIFIPRKALS